MVSPITGLVTRLLGSTTELLPFAPPCDCCVINPLGYGSLSCDSAQTSVRVLHTKISGVPFASGPAPITDFQPAGFHRKRIRLRR
jgi:hypothetical protein